MGILNITPDSFSDGGVFYASSNLRRAVEHAHAMVAAGATLLDVGGESTRPGAAAVSVEEELARVVPVIDALRREGLPAVISVDTSKPAVMRAAVAAGAGLINDVRALGADGALETAAELQVPVCLMHMQGQPRTMQQAPRYADVVGEVRAFLRERVRACEEAGIARERLILDPGFGFGKRLSHNLALLRGLPALLADGLPVLVGMSRKSMLGQLLGDAPVDARLHAGTAAAALAVYFGARIVRTHDVAATWDAVRVAAAVAQIER
ncbi:dihydropteroate synthase [Ectothiorhodospiraceae bacterium 2226]|nr:dihydropteroate synthase [Ectothiorhodospiraceae bacterium 2226]